MRVVHFDPPAGTIPHLPVCGDWGPPDTDATKEARGVTCPACLEVLRRDLERDPPPVSVPPHPA